MSSPQTRTDTVRETLWDYTNRIHNTSDDVLFQEVGLLAQSLAVIHEYMLLSCVPVQ